MAVVTSDFLAGAFTNFRAVFQQNFFAAMQKTNYGRIAMEVPSQTTTETYNWLGTVPAMRLWTDQRRVDGLNPFNYSLTNNHYEVTIEIDRDTFEDDRLGQITPRISQLGLEYPRFVDNTVINALVNGNVAGNTTYDGTTFYSTTHSVGASGNQSNYLLRTGDTITTLQTDFTAAKSQMRNFKDDQNRPMNLNPDFVLAPPNTEQPWLQLLTAAIIANVTQAAGVTNTFIGQADLAVSPYVTASTWHLLDTSNAFRPIIFQNRKPPEFAALNNPQDSFVFTTRMFQYGVDTRFVVGYGEPLMALKCAALIST